MNCGAPLSTGSTEVSLWSPKQRRVPQVMPISMTTKIAKASQKIFRALATLFSNVIGIAPYLTPLQVRSFGRYRIDYTNRPLTSAAQAVGWLIVIHNRPIWRIRMNPFWMVAIVFLFVIGGGVLLA